jgi:hypothetical protein
MLIDTDAPRQEVAASAEKELESLKAYKSGEFDELIDRHRNSLQRLLVIATTPGWASTFEFDIRVRKALNPDALLAHFEARLKERDLPEYEPSVDLQKLSFDCTREEAEEIRSLAIEVFGDLVWGYEPVGFRLR